MKRYALALGGALFLPYCLIQCGCTSAAFRTEANTFTAAYGDVLNEQMLLNLARLDNGHPAYFLAIGALNSKWNFAAEVGGAVSVDETDGVERDGSAHLSKLTGSSLFKRGFTGKLSSGSSPEFTIIPLNNDIVAQQLFQPLRADGFFMLYEMGYPIDLLLRVMVEEIRATTKDGYKWVLRNNPESNDQGSYRDFLTVCQVAADLQKLGVLRVQTSESSFVPLGGSPIGTAPSPEIVMKTREGGALWKSKNGEWQVGRNSNRLIFAIDWDVNHRRPGGQDRKGNSSESQKEGYWDPISRVIALGNVTDQELIERVTTVLSGWVGVQGSEGSSDIQQQSGTQISRVQEGSRINVSISLRSFNRALEMVAREQNHIFPIAGVPPRQNHPVLRTKWENSAGKLERPIGAVRYAGRRYVITDPVKAGVIPKTWNRDVFRLLVALNSQAAVDISKFQRQVLEVR